MTYVQELDLANRNGIDLVKESENNPEQSVFSFARWIKQFESEKYVLASCSWQQKTFYESLLNTDKNILLFNCFDPMFIGDHNTPLTQYIAQLNAKPNIRVVGNNVDDYLNYWCLWFSEQGRFTKYNKTDFTTDRFEKSFLCYQRSNTGYRKHLYDALQHYITYGTATYAAWDNGVTDVKNDVNSLGDLSIWNSHLINIVSETQYEWQDPYQVFISEKTWKPIYGMKPFIHFSNIYINDFLKSQGFELYWEDFGVTYNNTMNWDDQISLICQVIEFLKDQDLNSMYTKLKPKIDHNRNNLDIFIQRQLDKIENIKSGS